VAATGVVAARAAVTAEVARVVWRGREVDTKAAVATAAVGSAADVEDTAGWAVETEVASVAMVAMAVAMVAAVMAAAVSEPYQERMAAEARPAVGMQVAANTQK